jgi:photosystem II stability/assembly factor-like uncharacterized protein
MDGSSPQQITDAAQGVHMGRMLPRQNVLVYSLSSGGIVIESESETITLDDPTAMYPAWSPDGSLLAYQSTQTGGAHITLYDVADGSTRRLTDDLISGEAQPTWSPDGTQLAFVSARTGANDLFIYDLASDTLQSVTSGGVESPFWAALGVTLSAPRVQPPGFWTRVPAAITSTLHDIEMFAPDVGVAVGENNSVLRFQSGVWGRMDLSEVRTAFGGDRLTFFAVDVVAPDEAWAVGERGAIIHLQDDRWRVIESPTHEQLFAIEGDWIVGDNGIMLQRLGDAWQMVESQTPNALNGLYFLSEDDGWAVGDGSALLHWDGQVWERQLNAVRGDMLGIFGEKIVSEAGLFQLAENRWEGIAPLNVPSVSLTDLQIFEDGTGWAVGRDGALLYGNGVAWRVMPHITYADLNAASFSDPGNGWAVGVDGALLHYSTVAQPEAPPPTETVESIDDPVEAITAAWRCDILQGTAFYPYEIIIETPGADGTLTATGILPDFGRALVAMNGTLLTDDLPDIESDVEVIAWLELHEDTMLSGSEFYRADGILRLWLRADGELRGEIYRADDDSLVGEVRRCVAVE